MPAATPTGEGVVLRMFASNAALPLVQELTRAYSLEHTNVSFEVESGNFGAMLRRIHEGETPYFLTNYLPSETEQEIPLWAAPVGQDAIAVIVHPGNPVTGLSRSQLRDVFQGRVTNWSELGGEDQPITVISRESGSGTRAVFEHMIMGSRQTTPSARIAPGSSEVITSVSRDPFAIGYVSGSYLDNRVRALAVDGVLPEMAAIADSAYPLRSMLYIIGLREPDGGQPLDLDYRAFIGWVQGPDGQNILSGLAAPLLPAA